MIEESHPADDLDPDFAAERIRSADLKIQRTTLLGEDQKLKSLFINPVLTEKKDDIIQFSFILFELVGLSFYTKEDICKVRTDPEFDP